MSFGDEALPEEERVSEADAARGAPAGPRRPPTARPAPVPADDAPPAPAEEADPAEVLARERDEYLLALQRTQADFENYRKRIARLQDEQSARASQRPGGQAAARARHARPGRGPPERVARRERGRQGAARLAGHAAWTSWPRRASSGSTRPSVPFDPSVHDAVAHAEARTGDGGETAGGRGAALGLPLEGPGAAPRHGPRAGVS